MDASLLCPQCGSTILEQDIDKQEKRAKCNNCGAAFDFDGGQLEPVGQTRPDIPLPKGFEIQFFPSEMSIRVRWRHTRRWFFYVIFTVFWNLITLPFVVIALSSGEWGLLLGVSAHFLVGAGFLYYTIALLMNETVIDVSSHGLTIVSKPLSIPFNKNRYIRSADLEQLYVNKYTESTTNGNPDYSYSVKAIVQGQAKHLVLAKGFKTQEKAAYIELEIEKFLDIKDKRVN